MQQTVLIILLLFFVINCDGAMFVYAQTNLNQDKLSDRFATCFNQPDLLTTRKGKTFWFSSEEMKERATETVKPVFPPGCRCKGIITVFVLVDTDGKVSCAITKSGNPLLRVASMRAAKKWKFEPHLKDGKAISYAGLLTFSFDSSDEASF